MKRLLKFAGVYVVLLVLPFASVARTGEDVLSIVTPLQIGVNISTIAGDGASGYSGDGSQATNAMLQKPASLATGRDGQLYIADSGNHCIRKMDTQGIITTIAGSGVAGYSGDGGFAVQAQLHSPTGLYVTEDGSVYFADTGNHAIRRVSPSGVITTVAGKGEYGYAGDFDLATKARLHTPNDVVFDSDGIMYIADSGNHVIRSVSVNGVIRTVAGQGREYGYSGDGGAATEANLWFPMGVAIANNGRLYIADTLNNAIRVVSREGVIRTHVGPLKESIDPVVTASLSHPHSIQFDPYGILHITDTKQNRIVKVVGAALENVAGTGNPAFAGDGGLAIESSINQPRDIVFDNEGRIYIADTDNHRVRMISEPVPLHADAGENKVVFLRDTVRLDALASGGRGLYTYAWSVKSGPDLDNAQFSSLDEEDPFFTPTISGTYVLELRVGDSSPDDIIDTVTVVCISINPPNSVFVTDSLDSLSDISNSIDDDNDDERELVIRWNFDSDIVDFGNVHEIHVYVNVDSSSDFYFLGKADTATNEYLRWTENNALIAPEFQSGPQFGYAYAFRVFFLTRNGTPFFYGPFDSSGFVAYQKSTVVSPTPVIIPTKTPVVVVPTDTPVSVRPTNTPIQVKPTNTSTPIEPTDTPIPGRPTKTPRPVKPTNTPVPVEPTKTPGSGRPTLTPVPDEPTETPIPTDTPIVTRPTKTPVPVEPTDTPLPTDTPVTGGPTRTPTPEEPTETPIPTDTPNSGNPARTSTPIEPTQTPIPSEPADTPVPVVPTDTPVPEPTDTPIPVAPTDTPVPVEPSYTPVPEESTKTPVPVDPTITPVPTNTPEVPTPNPTITEIVVNAAMTEDELVLPGDENPYYFVASRTGTYLIETHAVNGREAVDTVLMLYGPDDATILIQSDDESGEGHFSRIMVSLQGGHTYYIYVVGFFDSTGFYGLDVTMLEPTPVPTATPTNTPTPTATAFLGLPEIRIEPLSLYFTNNPNSSDSGGQDSDPTPNPPQPTDTPVVPVPTDTPITPAPTDTPVVPVPTDTPITPEPTDTPVVPVPTDTPVVPEPTNTPTAKSTPVQGSGELIVCEDKQSYDDLSNLEDADPEDNRELVIRWNLDIPLVNEYHLYVRVHGGKYKFLGKAAANRNYYSWVSSKSNAGYFKDGPQFGESYEFKLYVIRKKGATLKEFTNAGPVEYLQEFSSSINAKVFAKQAVSRSNRSIFLKSGLINTGSARVGGYSTKAIDVDARSGRHALVQFDRIPSIEEREAMAAAGIELLSYIPDNAYWASIKQGSVSLLSVPFGGGVVWARSSTAIDKLSPAAASDEFPSYGLLPDGRYLIDIVVFADVTPQEAEKQLATAGAELRDRFDGHVFRAAVVPGELLSLSRLDIVEWVDAAAPAKKANNIIASQRTHATELRALPYELSGKNVVVGMWDEGTVFAHQDLASRLTIVNGSTVSDHATHVAGTIAGSGAGNANALGMAPSVLLRSYDWENDASEMRSGVNAGIQMSNHSYGLNVGWNNEGSGWEDTGSSLFGQYMYIPRNYDSVVYDTDLIVFKSAGNDRDDGPSVSQMDGPYDSLPPGGVAKNVITIGATADDDSMSSFSSWGPTDDGRVKPDLSANGVGLYSTLPNNNYGSFSGSSMASPSACGSTALLYQLYMDEIALRPTAATMKALLIHGANDLGRSGPDYEYGWGILNVKNTADMIKDRAWRTDTLTHASMNTYQFIVENGEPELKATLVWTDAPGSASASKALVNDLDLLLKSPSGQIYYPWILDKDAPSNAATNGVNTVDNVEQVLIPNPESGVWTLEVHGTTVPQGPQDYTLVSKSLIVTDRSKTFKIINEGQGLLTITGMNAEDEWVSFSPQAPFDLLPGDEVEVTVSVNFAMAPGGSLTSRIVVESNDADENPYPDAVYINADVYTPPTPVPTDTPVPVVPTDTPIAEEPSHTPVPVQPTASPVPTETQVPAAPTLTPIPAPTDTPVAVVPTSTPMSGDSETPVPTEPTATPTATLTATPTVTPTVVLVEPTALPTATPVPNPYLLPFDTAAVGAPLSSLRLTSSPSSLDAVIAVLPVSATYPQATNGIGLQVSPPAYTLSFINGPRVDLLDTPVRISCWYNASHEDFQIAVGAFADQSGQAGAAVYAMNSAPEYTAGAWHKIEIEVDARYTQVVPFLAMYNTNPDGEGTVSFDNLEILYGSGSDLGSEIQISDWTPNLWLNESDKGLAYRIDDSFVLEKNSLQNVSRFVGSYAQNALPYRSSVEIDVVKTYGDRGTLTIWIGNGPSAVQNDIPLWMLTPGVPQTIRVSNVTTDTPGPVNIVLQIAGKDNERIEITSIRATRLIDPALHE